MIVKVLEAFGLESPLILVRESCTRPSFGMIPLISEQWVQVAVMGSAYRKAAYSAAGFTGKSFPCAWDDCKNCIFCLLMQGDCSPTFLEPTTLEKLWNGLVLPLQPGPYQPLPLLFLLFVASGHVLITITGIKFFLPYTAACSWGSDCKIPGRRRGAGPVFKIDKNEI